MLECILEGLPFLLPFRQFFYSKSADFFSFKIVIIFAYMHVFVCIRKASAAHMFGIRYMVCLET